MPRGGDHLPSAGRAIKQDGIGKTMDLKDARWDCHPAVDGQSGARLWIETQVLLGMAPNTEDGCAQGVHDFVIFREGARMLVTEVAGACHFRFSATCA